MAEIRAKTKPLFLFSAGLYEFGQTVELAVALHPHWPLRQRYLAEKSLASFPLDFLQRASNMLASGQQIRAGSLFSRYDPAFSDLTWPTEVSALIAIDHRWPTDKASNTSGEIQRNADEVSILMLAPVLTSEKAVDNDEVARRWAAKKQSATWSKVTLPLSYT